MPAPPSPQLRPWSHQSSSILVIIYSSTSYICCAYRVIYSSRFYIYWKCRKGLNDGAKMGKVLELAGENPFGFQAVQIKALLDGRKNKAVRIIQARQTTSGLGVDSVNFNFGESSMVSESMDQRSTLMDELAQTRPPEMEFRGSE
ncbi:hypothetical protein PVK06_039259 [Gossypium arboreum]|uniref:Uncharacterized protein n=1 Tax=Gossypium arboreum TaxID=29729 RepID=A0ABR0N2E1_GOSAR|nr:hypothetical protein PVK06_039259 [Gossypium arboreum]